MKTPAPRIVHKLDVREGVEHPQKFPWRLSVGLAAASQPKEDRNLESCATIKSGSIDDLTCIGVFEYIPGKLRGKFMDEVHRVLAPEGKATFTVPYWNSNRAFQDYRYEWPPLCEQSFLYFNKGWREANKLELGLKCDFDFTYGYAWEPTTAARNDETRAFNTRHYSNCVDAAQLVLTKAKKVQ